MSSPVGERRATTDDAQALFDDHLALADRLARRYSHGSGVDDDLRQVARLGLLLAARRFDPELGVFVRFATVTIVGELKKHLRDTGWSIHVPRSLQEDAITVSAAIERLTARLAGAPLTSEIADHTGFSNERVIEALRVREVRFSEPAEQHDESASVESDPAAYAVLTTAVDQLDDADRHLLSLRFEAGLSQVEISRHIGVSQPQVHRRLGVAIQRLREHMALDEHLATGFDDGGADG